MSQIEQIVRPFQRIDIAPARPAVGNTKVHEPVEVSLGKGPAVGFVLSVFTNINAVVTDDYVEVKREVHIKRIENPSDSSQFVDVERIDKLWTRKADDPDARINIELNNED